LSDLTLASGRQLYRHIDIGIEPNWFLVFRIIMERRETTISEISSILHFAHPSVITIVRKMDQSGYLEIIPDVMDKRKQLIRLSQKATKQLPELEHVWQACEDGVKSIFQDDTFLQELDKVERALEEQNFFHRVLGHLEGEGIILEPFSATDAKSFADLNFAWICSYFQVEPIDQLILGDPMKNVIKKGGHIFMAKRKGISVGTFALLTVDEDEVELGRMAVRPDVQGLGIGARLMKKAIAFAQSQNMKAIILYSNTKLKPAIQLYEKFGFKKESFENTQYERANIKMRLVL